MKITAIVCFCGVSTQFFFWSISADGPYDFYSVIVDPFYFHSLIKLTFHVLGLLCLYDKQNNTWARVDMKFLFLCSTQYLTLSQRTLVSYWDKHSKRISISTRAHVLLSI